MTLKKKREREVSKNKYQTTVTCDLTPLCVCMVSEEPLSEAVPGSFMCRPLPLGLGGPVEGFRLGGRLVE